MLFLASKKTCIAWNGGFVMVRAGPTALNPPVNTPN
jgi:hypothetical protein